MLGLQFFSNTIREYSKKYMLGYLGPPPPLLAGPPKPPFLAPPGFRPPQLYQGLKLQQTTPHFLVPIFLIHDVVGFGEQTIKTKTAIQGEYSKLKCTMYAHQRPFSPCEQQGFHQGHPKLSLFCLCAYLCVCVSVLFGHVTNASHIPREPRTRGFCSFWWFFLLQICRICINQEGRGWLG